MKRSRIVLLDLLDKSAKPFSRTVGRTHYVSSCPQTIPEISAPPTITEFQTKYLDKSPVLMRGMARTWPAVNDPKRRWGNLEYLQGIVGDLVVNVEIGKHYMDPALTQAEVSFPLFLEYLRQSSQSTSSEAEEQPLVYLAQYQLFNNVPELKKDIDVETLESLLGDRKRAYAWNAFFGPKSTISPAHHDPYHNLYTQVRLKSGIPVADRYHRYLPDGSLVLTTMDFTLQVHGYKYIRLYPTSDSPYLYPSSKPRKTNTTIIDVTNPDLKKYPDFGKAKEADVVLGPGDVIYIPKKWWHYVESLDTSLSISMWWI